MAETVEILLVRNLHEIFGEHEQTRRRATIEALLTADCVFSDPHGHGVGRDAIDRAVTVLQEKFPGYVFTQLGPAEALHDAGRLAWSFGPPGEPRITGLDVIVSRDCRIAALYTFLDPPTAR